MPLTKEGRDLALTRLLTMGTLWLGLTADGIEIDSPNYARRAIDFNEPVGEIERSMTNKDEVGFLIDSPVDIDGWTLSDSMGNVLLEERFDGPYRMGANQELVFRPGDLRVSI